MYTSNKFLAYGAWLIPLLISQSAKAQTLEVAPITIDLPTGRAATSIRVTNHGTQQTTIQLRAFDWSQGLSGEQLQPTKDIMLSPPFSNLAPGDIQTIRVILTKNAEKNERAYRLLIDQLPHAKDTAEIHVALRISLPVFAAPSGSAQAKISWKLVGNDPVKRNLIVRNEGTRRVKLLNLRMDQLATAPGFTFQYVLAGGEAAIPVEAGPSGWALPGSSVHVSATSDQGKVEGNAPIMPAA